MKNEMKLAIVSGGAGELYELKHGEIIERIFRHLAPPAVVA